MKLLDDVAKFRKKYAIPYVNRTTKGDIKWSHFVLTPNRSPSELGLLASIMFNASNKRTLIEMLSVNVKAIK